MPALRFKDRILEGGVDLFSFSDLHLKLLSDIQLNEYIH